MSLSSEDMLTLMAYADGELEGAELEEAQKLLARDPDSVRFVEQIAGLGSIVSQGYGEAAGKTVAAFDVADSVMALTKESGKVTSITAAKAAKAAKADKKSGGNSVKIGAGIAAALALAASFFLLFAQHRGDEAPMASNNTPAVQAVQPGSGGPGNSTVAAVSTAGGSGVSVSAVDSPGSTVSVFYLPTANELSTSVVVWVDETGEK